MNTSRHVKRIGCWLIFSVSVASLRGAEFTIDLQMAEPLTIAYSPSGEQIAVGGLAPERDGPADGVVALVDATPGKLQSMLQHSGWIERPSGGFGNINPIHAVAYCPDGKVLAVAAEMGLKLWDPAAGKILATLAGYGIDEKQWRENVVAIAFSPDGKLLAAIDESHSKPGRLRLWDVGKCKLIRGFEIGYFGYGTARVAFSPDGSMLVTPGQRGGMVLWRVADGTQVEDKHLTSQIPSLQVGGGVLSPDSKLQARRGGKTALLIYDMQTRKIVGTLVAGGPCAFSPDGTSIAVAFAGRGQARDVQQTAETTLTIWKISNVLDGTRMAIQARAVATEMVQRLTAPQADWQLLRKLQDMLAILAGPQAEAATPILLDGLKNPEVNNKQFLIDALGNVAKREPKARAAVTEALGTAKTVDARIAAAKLLARLPADVGREAVPTLVQAAVYDESPQVRSAATAALRKLDPKAHAQAAQQSQSSGPPADRVERRDGKLYYQGRSLEEWINRLSVSYMPNEIGGRPLPDEPLAAIHAIGPDSLPLLLDALQSKEQPVRRAAAAGLEALGPQVESAMEPLFDVIANADAADLSFVAGVPGGVASEAADSLALILKDRQEPPARLVELTSSDNPAARLCAARAVAIMSPNHPRGLPILKVAMAAAESHAIVPAFVPNAWRFGPQPNVNWLGRVLADDEAPAAYRMQAADSLERMGPRAQPALSSVLKALTTSDPSVGYSAVRVIHKTGPQALPAVRDALQAATDDHTRGRLAAALWGLGDEGRTALKEVLKNAESAEAESLWWAAVAGTWDGEVAWKYQKAIREALHRTGQMVPAQPPPSPEWQRLKRQPPSEPPRPRPPKPIAFQPPGVAWSVKVLADKEAPPLVRSQAPRDLSSTTRSELAPHVQVLVQGLASETDPAMVPHYAELLQRIGLEAIPPLKAAFEQAQTDQARRHLLIVLSARFGKEGRQAIEELRQRHPEFSQLFKTLWQSNAPRVTPDRAATCLLTIRVQVPETTPAQDSLYVTGSDAAFGNWNPKGLQLLRKDSGEYEAQVRLKMGSRVEYKITRGSWETVEKGSNQEELTNRGLTATSDQTIAIRVENWRDQLNK